MLPVSPPPDIDVEGWHGTIGEIERRAPDRLALVHFGVATDVDSHLERLGTELDRWAELVRDGATSEEFAATVRPDAGPDVARLDAVAPLDQSWQGLRRYWDKRVVRRRRKEHHVRLDDVAVLVVDRRAERVGLALGRLVVDRDRDSIRPTRAGRSGCATASFFFPSKSAYVMPSFVPGGL